MANLKTPRIFQHRFVALFVLASCLWGANVSALPFGVNKSPLGQQTYSTPNRVTQFVQNRITNPLNTLRGRLFTLQPKGVSTASSQAKVLNKWSLSRFPRPTTLGVATGLMGLGVVGMATFAGAAITGASAPILVSSALVGFSSVAASLAFADLAHLSNPSNGNRH